VGGLARYDVLFVTLCSVNNLSAVAYVFLAIFVPKFVRHRSITQVLLMLLHNGDGKWSYFIQIFSWWLWCEHFQNIPGAQNDRVGGKLYAFGSFELGINAKGSLI
jgi:hypothetical protein